MDPRLVTSEFRYKQIQKGDNISELWDSYDVLTIQQKKKSRYITGLACSTRCVTAAYRLRYEIFNLELGEGLEESEITGLDKDKYDDQMTHLVLIDKEADLIVGTYRMQTVMNGFENKGVYSAQEYDLSPLSDIYHELVELGRACLSEDHRTMTTLIQLWMGIASFLNLTNHRYVFGCCSLTTEDPDDGWRALKTIRRRGNIHSKYWLKATEDYNCGSPDREHLEDIGPEGKIPKLFNAYLRLGCDVISEPAIDREFGTVDFLILLDARENVKMSMVDMVE